MAGTFDIFGINEEDSVTAAEHIIGDYSNTDVEAVARTLFHNCTIIEIWEASVLIARIRNPRGRRSILAAAP